MEIVGRLFLYKPLPLERATYYQILMVTSLEDPHGLPAPWRRNISYIMDGNVSTMLYTEFKRHLRDRTIVPALEEKQ